MSSAPPVTGARRWLVLAVVLLCFLPAAMDVTILTITVPTLAHDLRASPSALLWTVDVYSLLMVGLVLVSGPLGDRIGHQRLLLAGLGVFSAASALCAVAPGAHALIGARALLAVGASMVIPATLALIRQTFGDGRDHAVAIGAWSAVAAGASALGPVVGGFLLQHFWWGSIFLVNLPIVAVALPAVALLLPNRVEAERQPWEATSPVLSIVGFLGSAYAIIAFTHDGVGPLEVAVPAVLGLTALALFVRRQQRAPHPMLDLSLFRLPGLRAGVVASVLPVLVMVGFELQLVQFLQFVEGMSAEAAAFYLIPMPVAATVAGPVGGMLLSRLGRPRADVPAGLLLAVAGYVLVASGTVVPFGLALIGFGHGLVQMVASNLIMSTAPSSQAGAAAGIESVSYEAGAGLGIAVFGTVTAVAYRAFLPPGQPTSPLKAGTSPETGRAFADAFHTTTWLAAALTLATVFLATPQAAAAEAPGEGPRAAR
ncbi:MFS transporter [Streptomyces sp. NRRL F-4489]|uniref:MFS transporter n=1 Tax=Streptomyces sp. NRRL F-4489 TaxID=1609095 RepID=UPI00074882F2|nr:MFS transporter [Streptomyces sp. NRRL F-4489]KUL36300.1 MFS transporter [Streptomyces sp. NRRL F-4489]